MDKSPGIIWKCLHNCNLQHVSEKNPFQQTNSQIITPRTRSISSTIMPDTSPT
jgi:hypothetical protein